MNLDLSQIHLQPEVLRAARAESRARAEAFLPGAQRICTVPVRALTPRLYAWLHAIRSPFLFEHDGTLDDCLRFLWWMSPQFVFPTHAITTRQCRAAHAAWLAAQWPRLQARRRKLATLCRAIRAFVEAALFDLEKSDGPSRPAVAHFEASLIDEFAAAYGWKSERLDSRGLPDYSAPGIRDMPLAMLIQCRRCRTARESGAQHVGNPLSDTAERKAINRLTRRIRKAGKQEAS